jgi:alpha-L-fucosidase
MQGENEGYWATADGVTTGDITLKWSEPITVKYIVIQEYIALGQRVREFVIEAYDGNDWQEIASGTTIGYKRILPLADSVNTDQLRIRFLDSRAPLTIARIAVY